MFQEAADDTLLQHDEIYVQHVDDDEGKSQHTLLVSTGAGHVALHGEESDPQGTA